MFKDVTTPPPAIFACPDRPAISSREPPPTEIPGQGGDLFTALRRLSPFSLGKVNHIVPFISLVPMLWLPTPLFSITIWLVPTRGGPLSPAISAPSTPEQASTDPRKALPLNVLVTTSLINTYQRAILTYYDVVVLLNALWVADPPLDGFSLIK